MLAEERQAEVALEAELAELDPEMAALVAANPLPGEGAKPINVLPVGGCSLAALGGFLHQCGLQPDAIKELKAGAAKLNMEQAAAAVLAKAAAAAGSQGGGVGQPGQGEGSGSGEGAGSTIAKALPTPASSTSQEWPARHHPSSQPQHRG